MVDGHGQYQHREDGKLNKREKQSLGFRRSREEMPRLWTPTLTIFQPSDHRHVERVHHLPQEKGMLSPKLERRGPILSPH
jgi:hypothetical protein